MSDEQIWSSVAIFFLLMISSLLSASETAMTAASHPRMVELERQGNRRAALVNSLRAHKERLIGAILLGNNLVNILASALATSLTIAAYGEFGIVIATVVMTVLIVVFGEIMPKVYALNNADRAALGLAPAMRPVYRLLSPVTVGIDWVVRFGLRRAGAQTRFSDFDDRTNAAEESLRGAISLHAGPHEDLAHERAMLRSVLDLGDVKVSEIMVHRRNVTAIDIDQPIAAIIDQALETPFTRVPLWKQEPENVVGVLHAKSLLRAMRTHHGEIDAIDISTLMTAPWFVPESTDLLEQLHAFRDRGEQLALVVDEYGALMGIVTLEDILEEIVGDISDEHAPAPEGVTVETGGSYVVEGSLTIRDLNRQFGWRLPDEPASTVAGLVLHEARTIPQVGQVFEFHGFRFEILRRQRNRIVLLRLRPPTPLTTPLAAP